MTSGNLATSCGLSIFPQMEACTSGTLLKFLIDKCELIFEESDDEEEEETYLEQGHEKDSEILEVEVTQP